MLHGDLQAVAEDNKQRFKLEEKDGQLLVRANQGHTITVGTAFCSIGFYGWSGLLSL